MSIYNKLLLFLKEPFKNDEIFIEIVNDITPLIKKNVNLVNKNMQDDFQQQILLKLYDIMVMNKFKVEIFKEIDFNNNKSLEFINKLDEPLLEKFINQSSTNKTIYENRRNSEKCFYKFIEDFTNFFGDIKMLNFLDKSFYNLRIDFLRKCKNEIHVSLDEKIYENYEIIEEVKQTFSIDTLQGVSDKDKSFLKLFIQGDELLTLKEVANLLNVSPQYISKKMKIIKQKIKKRQNNNYFK